LFPHLLAVGRAAGFAQGAVHRRTEAVQARFQDEKSVAAIFQRFNGRFFAPACPSQI